MPCPSIRICLLISFTHTTVVTCVSHARDGGLTGTKTLESDYVLGKGLHSASLTISLWFLATGKPGTASDSAPTHSLYQLDSGSGKINESKNGPSRSQRRRARLSPDSPTTHGGADPTLYKGLWSSQSREYVSAGNMWPQSGRMQFPSNADFGASPWPST